MANVAKKYKAALAKVDRTRRYKIDDAMKLVKETATKKFDETVDLAINLGVDPKHADQVVRAADHLIRVLRVDAQVDREVHRLVELLRGGLLHELHRVVDLVPPGAIDLREGCLVLLRNVSHVRVLLAISRRCRCPWTGRSPRRSASRPRGCPPSCPASSSWRSARVACASPSRRSPCREHARRSPSSSRCGGRPPSKRGTPPAGS